jgi:hypothetical protein
MVIEDYDGLEGLDVLNHVNEKLAKDLPGLAGLADWWLLELAMSSDNSEDVKALRNPEAVKILRRRILRRQLEWGVLGDRWLEHHRETAREVAREMLADGTPLVPALRLRLEKAVAEP